MLTIVSWNIARRRQPWRDLLEIQADVALLQEAGEPPPDIAPLVSTSPYEPWYKYSPHTGESYFDRWPKVVRLSDRVEVKWFRQEGPTVWSNKDEILTSGAGTSDAALVTPLDGGEPFMVVSMYARWLCQHPLSPGRSGGDQPDGSAHRIISDISAFVGPNVPPQHRILAAGDLNMNFGGTHPFKDRAQTVLDRMKVLGFEYAGPPASQRKTGPTCSFAPHLRVPGCAHLPLQPKQSRRCICPVGPRFRIPRIPRGNHYPGNERS